MQAKFTRWAGDQTPSVATLREKLRTEPHNFMIWSNGPAVVYATHAHSYDKLLVCLRGSITFTLDATSERIDLVAGDRLYLPAQTYHGALVGPAGVECAEAQLLRR